ncbi:MAG: lipoyl synthase [Acidimicrobiales bacterium]
MRQQARSHPTSPALESGRLLHARWLGSVAYSEAWAIQNQLFAGTGDHLLLLEHPPVYTRGVRTDPSNLLVDPHAIGADDVTVNRGGDVTFHGPGQVVGYPVLNVPGKRGGGMADTVAYVSAVEQIVIDTLTDFGLESGRLEGFPGVWIDPFEPTARKIAAVGVRLSRGRSMHGFALNVSTDMGWFDHIIPCGITDKAVTTMTREGVDVGTAEVARTLAHHASVRFGLTLDWAAATERRTGDTDLSLFSRGAGAGEAIIPTRESPTSPDSEVPVRLKGRLAQAGISGGLSVGERKPDWMRVKLQTGPNYNELKRKSRQLDLVTVCEEAGCPNIFECWNEGTATFMLLGERCTRACGFCLVDTRKPEGVDEGEPKRVATAVADLGLDFAVLTMVARDDLSDGGATVVAETVRAIRGESPGTGIEVLISDLQGSAESLGIVIDAQPDILNHNIETVISMQRAVRPSASYGRSLGVLARAKQAGLKTKSGMIVGMGETPSQVRQTLTDLAAIGVDIVTIGQYLRPTTHHLPIHRWWDPKEFAELKRFGERKLGIPHVESSPLTRSSHHAGAAADAVM